MPQVDIKYTSELQGVKFDHLFKDIEDTLNKCDPSAGVCKSRAFLADSYRHPHIYVSIFLLKKEHRDNTFMKNLQENLINVVRKSIPADCYYAVELGFSGSYYFTDKT